MPVRLVTCMGVYGCICAQTMHMCVCLCTKARVHLHMSSLTFSPFSPVMLTSLGILMHTGPEWAFHFKISAYHS